MTLAGHAQVQSDGSPYPHKTGRDTKPPTIEIRSQANRKGVNIRPSPIQDVKAYGVVRIGEYYWANRNLSNGKTTLWN